MRKLEDESKLSFITQELFVAEQYWWYSCAFRAVKMNLANEGLEARRKDEEIAAKKRKAEEEKVWEGTIKFYPYSWLPSWRTIS